MKWLARQEQISAAPQERVRSDVGSEEVETGRCVLSQSTIRVLKTQGLKSVGGLQSGERGHQLAFGRLGHARLSAITAFGQLAPSLSVGLKFGCSGVWGVGLAGVGREPHATEHKRAPWTYVQATDV
jgi:hypothetical protein